MQMYKESRPPCQFIGLTHQGRTHLQAGKHGHALPQLFNSLRHQLNGAAAAAWVVVGLEGLGVRLLLVIMKCKLVVMAVVWVGFLLVVARVLTLLLLLLPMMVALLMVLLMMIMLAISLTACLPMGTTPHDQVPLFLTLCRNLAASTLCSLACAQALADRQRGRHCKWICVLKVHALLMLHT